MSGTDGHALIKPNGFMRYSATGVRDVRACVAAGLGCPAECSHCLAWDQMCVQFDSAAMGEVLVVDASWANRWSAMWRHSGVAGGVFGAGPGIGADDRVEPVRRSARRAGQRHRPGLQYLVS